jgi:hypothetical protein
VLRCGASSGVGILAERFSLDRSGSQIEEFIDFESYYTFNVSDIAKPCHLTRYSAAPHITTDASFESVPIIWLIRGGAPVYGEYRDTVGEGAAV